MVVTFNVLFNEKTLGATADTLSEEWVDKSPINAILLQMKFAQNGATLPTKANVLTQFGSEIRVTYGGKTIFKMSPTDLFELMQRLSKKNLVLHISDGTGADNHIMTAQLIIPFGKHIDFDRLNGKYGLDPTKKTVAIEIDYPADGNNIDGRKLTIAGIEVVGSSPNKYIQRNSVTKTPNSTTETAYHDLPNGSNIVLQDLFIYQTTSLGDGTTSDIETIEKIWLEQNTEAVLGDLLNAEFFRHMEPNLSATATAPAFNSDYIYRNFASYENDYEGFKLDKSTRIAFQFGDTNDIRIIAGIEYPL